MPPAGGPARSDEMEAGLTFDEALLRRVNSQRVQSNRCHSALANVCPHLTGAQTAILESMAAAGVRHADRRRSVALYLAVLVSLSILLAILLAALVRCGQTFASTL